MKIITITTDFGQREGYVGVMKGVIFSIAPQVEIIDLTHEVPPQDILSGQIILDDSVPYFPAGTIHIAVVDPGVGTTRRPIAARLGEQYFVGPDNGLITPLLERAEADRLPVEIVRLTDPTYWLKDVSNVFHGRDIFAPVAAHIAAGVPLFEMGEQINDPVRLEMPEPVFLDNGWRGQVIQVDHFGNLATNLKAFHLDGMGAVAVYAAGKEIHGVSRTFGDGKPGDLLAIIDSSNRLSVCVVNGSAARAIPAGMGAVIEVRSVKTK